MEAAEYSPETFVCNSKITRRSNSEDQTLKTHCRGSLRFYNIIIAYTTHSLVTTAWRVLRLRMEERPPDMEGSCEYIE
jgi:hypothetical protein